MPALSNQTRHPGIGDFLVNVVLLALAVLFAYGGFLNWQSALRLPRQPQPVTLAGLVAGEAPMDWWVTLSGLTWDCSDIISYRLGEGKIVTSRTLAAFTDETRSVLGVASFEGTPSCQDIMSSKATGIISAMSAKAYTDYVEKGLKLPSYANATTHLSLCTWCGRSNSLLGAILCPIIALICLVLAVLRLLDGPRHSSA